MPLLEATQWTMEVERGPNWPYIRPYQPAGAPADDGDLAEAVWNTMQQHFAQRVVLELDSVGRLNSRLIGQLVLLHKRVATTGGVLRLSGVRDTNLETLRIIRLNSHLSCYATREEAVMCTRPPQPR